MPTKTNAARALEKLGIAFSVREYEVDPEDLTAETVARKVGMEPASVFKTLVAKGNVTGVLLAVIPGDAELDLKALSRASANKTTDTVPLKDVQPLTGYVRGGVTALAAKKEYPVFLDQVALAFPQIAVSAGMRGQQLVLSPADYARAVKASVASISRPKAGS